MDQPRDSWRDTVRAVGEALIDLLRAEAAVVGESWQRSARELRTIATIGVVLAYLALICLPTLLIVALLMGLSEGLGWPMWGAALTVAGVVALVALILMSIIRQRVKSRLESPAATLRHRFADHRAWWNDRIVGSDVEAESQIENPASTGAVAQEKSVAQGENDGETDTRA